MNTNSLLSFLSETTPVTVAANETLPNRPLITPIVNKMTGVAKTDNAGNPLGSICLVQHQRTLNGSFLNARRRVAFIGGTIDELTRLINEKGIKEGTEVPGKIVIKESLEPMYNGHNPKMNPATAESVTIDVLGNKMPVYMQMFYTDDVNKKDVLIRSAEDATSWINSRTVLANMNSQHIEIAAIPKTEGATA